MKRTFMTHTIFILLLAVPVCAQENDSLAKITYAVAKSSFADGRYKDAIAAIKYSEIYAGGPSSRSLYFRIRALNELSNTDISYLPELQSAITRFMEVTDRNSYPIEKYQEIITIRDSKEKLAPDRSGIIKTSSPGETEKVDYDKAIKTNTMEGYKEFLDKYSFTTLSNDIQKRYNVLLDEQWAYREHKDKAVRKKFMWEPFYDRRTPLLEQ
jgi:hypothetical protein